MSGPSQMKSADYLHPQNNWNNAIFILSAQGRLEYTSDGSCYYEGDWFEDIRQGYGVSKYPDGTTYEGEWFDGNRCGYGTMHWKDRDEIYSGRWVAGKQEGQGSHAWHILRVRTTQYTLPNVYDGEWKNGVRHGFGVFHYPNGSKYAGYWKDNMKHGKVEEVT
ncbi:MORN repeat protein [Opisthorchis viverrini]|uniref:MORN repeat protein n=1 Tax=Opisthorchis viverrini TaxID=6198 RepID=A0A1S8WPL8_OPIVI|nr:MORN repeat protein [Opisthorchis viverrini]